MSKKKGTPMERRTQKIKEKYTPFLEQMSSDSQNRQILRYMIDHRGITQEEAVEHLNCFRLSARIFELKEDGIDIVTFMEDNRNRRGQHARYFLND